MAKSDKEMYHKMTGHEVFESRPTEPTFEVSVAMVADRERMHMQALEVISIKTAADAIEITLKENGFARPSVYSILTAGMEVPKGADLLGKYCEEGSAFASFPKTDIYGHSGEVYAVKTENDQTMLIMKGRAHPYEWSKYAYADMLLAHPLQVMKELARRQRAQDSEDPVFILTYLTGVREDRDMQPGHLAVILDDTPADNDTHPGHGPRAILDKFVGERFQAKNGRSSDQEIAQMFVEFAKKRAQTIFSAAAIGTPGTTEFQSDMEVGLYDAAYNEAMKNGNFSEKVRQVSEHLQGALLFGMGITAELAVLRQTFGGEADFKVLALGLATDAVGGKQSAEINHHEVVRAAMEKGEQYRDLIMDFLNSVEFLRYSSGIQLMEDHSISHAFAA